MRILSFEYQDADGWTLEPMKLDPFNLFVGVSGAGKTRIVQAIEWVCSLALGTLDTNDVRGGHDVRGASFTIDFEHGGVTYHWEAETEGNAPEPGRIRTEHIEQDGRPIVRRTSEGFIFKEQAIPRLDRAKSAIAILKEDPSMTPLHSAFSRCVARHVLDFAVWSDFRHATDLDRFRARYRSLQELGSDLTLSIHQKAECFQELFPEAFHEIAEAFRDAFPSIQELKVLHRTPTDDLLRGAELHEMFIAAREEGVRDLIPYGRLSSGMQRYLSFLVHLSFAPRGTVVLIDELESSFGINCLPAATDFLLGRAPDLQLVLTSHHPYIIQKIPTDLWKIITRQGSHVRVLDTASIPALQARSHVDRFTRLINLPEYEQGIQA